MKEAQTPGTRGRRKSPTSATARLLATASGTDLRAVNAAQARPRTGAGSPGEGKAHERLASLPAAHSFPNEHYPPSLKFSIDKFLPDLRVGIDVGEWAGGIAVIQGANVRHAETYTDYHATTLEDRRKIRRGRRTRHAKKMRLARLRSWIRRQKLPDGTQLPDPYHLIRQERFHHPPEELPRERKDATGAEVVSQTFFDKGKHPYTSPWVYAVTEGLRKDPDAFVVALTHIFQKRGYKYDRRALTDLSSNKLKEFLDSCCQLEKAGELRLQLERLIEQLEKTTRDNELRNAFNQALQRPPEPRKAVPRQLKEDELRKLVSAFATSVGLTDAMTKSWQKELIGLLNKVLREPRFENRLVAGCSWCGKQTPRKNRPGIRESAFRAAVVNIRKARVLPLEEPEKKDFLLLFQDLSFRAKGLAARKADFERLLRKYDAQRNMASQLAELCGNDAPRGRTGLCHQHIKMQEQGGFRCNRHPGWICKLNGLDEGHIRMEFAGGIGPIERLARNPCREAHEERIVQRLGQILFNPDGSPKYGDLPALISIEFPKPNTAQSLECPSCCEKLAVDLKTNQKIRGLKIGIAKKPDPHTVFLCPTCNNNLFVQGKKRFLLGGSFQDRWVTLDVSEADIRKAKGGMKAKKDSEYWKEVNGKCVYCGKDVEKGEREHIFPQSRGGPNLDYNIIASCMDCNGNKASRTPYEWISRDNGGPCSWGVFESRVKKLPLPQRKKEILLSDKDQYPENPIALARATARKRAFIARIKNMLLSHGVSADKIADNYERGKIVIQSVEGWMTSRLRQSWRFHEDGSPNFPVKQDWNLHNHAEDAAIIAASPPHTWRERVFVQKRVYDKQKNTWGPSELADRRLTDTERESYEVWTGCAPFDLAPEWSRYFQDCHNKRPLVVALGSYSLTWRRSFLDTQFYQLPKSKEDSEQEPIRRLMLTALKWKQVPRIVDAKIRDTLTSIASELGADLKKVAERPIGETAILKLNSYRKQRNLSDVRRVKVRIEGIGYIDKLVRLAPNDGPSRYTRPTEQADAAILWGRRKVSRKGRKWEFGHSVITPEPLVRLGWDKVRPGLPRDVEIRLTVRRGQHIFLPAKFPSHPEGWYRIFKFQEQTLTALPESAVAPQLAKMMGIEIPSDKRPNLRGLTTEDIRFVLSRAFPKQLHDSSST